MKTPRQRQSLIEMPHWSKRMADSPFAEFSLERAVGSRWMLRDIQAGRLKLSPVSDEDLRVLTELGLIELHDDGPALTPTGAVVLSGQSGVAR